MRNVFVIVVLLVLFFSCRKNSGCYTCITTFNVTQRDSVESVSWSVNDTRDLCDMNEDQIGEYEKKYTDTLVEVSGSVTTTTLVTTKCTN